MKLTIVWVFLIGLIQHQVKVAETATLNWRTVSHCTIANGNNNNNGNQAQQSNSQSNNQLELSCGENDDSLLYIAWSHHGFRSPTTSTSASSRASSTSKSCAFDFKSVDDCMVRVDYVANECNGLARCQISLDSHYLHSCKAYSHYLFIVYQCIPKSRTFDICQQQPHNQAVIQHIGDDTFYLRSPMYPDEYATNLNCQLELKSQLNTSLEIEVLEFDMEEVDTTQKNTVETSIRMLNSNRAAPQKASSLACQRDYLSIGGEHVRLCGNLSPFTTILNVVGFSSLVGSAIEARTTFKFYSDDALTRRGFWLKLKALNLQSCPPGFILINHVCLRIYEQELSWYEAHNFCSKSGYSLALIDSFELDKQLNRVLFDTDFVVSSLFNLTKSSTTSTGVNPGISRFWTGIRHLNESHWFDFKNDPLRFKWDEATWWPWLVVDPASYSQGSCVAKRNGAMFLDDCYKRMPFACQFIESPPSSSLSVSSLSSSEAASSSMNESSSWTLTVPQVDMVVVSSSAAQEPLISTAATAMVTGLDNRAASTDLRHHVKASINSSDSSLIIVLVSLILVLIASINTVVIIIFCKKRKLLMKHELKNSVDQMEEKGSNQSGSNSSTNSSNSSSSSSGGFTAILPYPSTNKRHEQQQQQQHMDLSNSLSYHCLSSSNNTATSSTMIHPLNKHHHHAANRTTTLHHHDSITTTDNEYNSYNYLHSNNRRSCMFVPIQYQNTSLHQLKASMTANNMMQQQNPSAIDTTTSQQDPLAHIYETISISSNFNMPPSAAATFYQHPQQRVVNRCYQPKADELTSSSCSTTTTSTNSGGDLMRSNHLRTLLHNNNNNNNNSIITPFHNQYHNQHIQPTTGYFIGDHANFVATNADPNHHLDDDQTIMFTSRVEAVV